MSASTAPRVGRILGKIKQIWKFETLISPVTDKGKGAAAAALRELPGSSGVGGAWVGGGIPRKV